MAPLAARIFWVCLALALVGKWKLSKEKSEVLCFQPRLAASLPRKEENRTPIPPSTPRRCRDRHHNPGTTEDGRQLFRSLEPSGERPAEGRMRNALRRQLEESLAPWPGLLALSLSVWLGDLTQFPPWLTQRYRAAGLSHALALSGAHILSLWFCLKAVLYLLAPWCNGSRFLRKAFYTAKVFPLLFCALALVLVNPGNEPLARAAAMVGLGRLLVVRRMESSLVQQACSACALLLLWDPARVASDSFILSAVSTLVLFGVLETMGKRVRGLRQYAAVSVSMPVLLWPLTAFIFGKVSLLAPLNGLLFGWIWGLVWVPLGFVSPVLPWVPFGSFLLAGLESLWQLSLQQEAVWGHWMSRGYWSVVRLTWAEYLVCSAALFLAFKALWNDAPSIDFYRKVGSN